MKKCCLRSSMLGERDRIRNAVGWELDESATSSNNNDVQQSSWVSGIGNVSKNTKPSNKFDGSGTSRSKYTYNCDEDYDFDDDNETDNQQNYGDASDNGAANIGKEVRYAPLPLALQSPTHQVPLQRAHSR